MWRSWLARAVWDREVEGSSPFTPTIGIYIEPVIQCDGGFCYKEGDADMGVGLLLVSVISLYIRRLHDLKHTATIAFWALVPFVNFALYLYLVCAPGKRGVNDFEHVARPQLRGGSGS